MPARPTADTVGSRSTRRWRWGIVATVAFAAVTSTACSQSRPVTITSECGTDVLVDWLYRAEGGTDVVEEDYVIEAGEHVYADAVETEYIALTADGVVLAETSLPVDQLDAQGANPFPPMTLPSEACGQLAPAPESGGGY